MHSSLNFMATYSFDIFDTCLTRKCGSPDNFFDILARRAFYEEVDERCYQAFVIERKRAEESSNTIEQIYEEFHLPIKHIRKSQELIKIELALEEEMMSPVYSIKQKIEKLRNKGHRIIFISDMYLSGEYLKIQLAKHGVFQEGDSLYVSSDHNVTKSSGRLYKLIHNELGIRYRLWHHCGDNHFSDVNVPRRLGIHAKRIYNGYSPYQKTTKNICCTGFNWAGITAGLSRSLVLAEKCQPHKLLYIDLILPLFTTFTYKVLKKACEEGISRLFFCTRDAFPLYEIALQLQSYFPKLEIKLLYISQVSLYQGNQKNAVRYFRNIGLASYLDEGIHCGIVDIRTSGNSLSSINSLLGSKYIPVNGYYFESYTTECDREYNLFSLINDQYLSYKSKFNRLTNNYLIYELLFPLNNLKKTIDYSDEGVPLFEEERSCELSVKELDDWLEWRKKTMHLYMDSFKAMGLVPYFEKILEQSALQNLVAFFISPHKQYAAALEKVTVKIWQGQAIPYVKKSPLFLYYVLKRKTVWRLGTISINLPNNMFQIIEHLRRQSLG